MRRSPSVGLNVKCGEDEMTKHHVALVRVVVRTFHTPTITTLIPLHRFKARLIPQKKQQRPLTCPKHQAYPPEQSLLDLIDTQIAFTICYPYFLLAPQALLPPSLRAKYIRCTSVEKAHPLSQRPGRDSTIPALDSSTARTETQTTIYHHHHVRILRT